MGHETIITERCCCGHVFIDHDPAGCVVRGGCSIGCRGFHDANAPQPLHDAMHVWPRP